MRFVIDLMDAAYDAEEIRAYSRDLGHTAIIDLNPRRSVERKEAMKREAQARRATGYVFADQRRYNERSTVERVYGRLKDEFGGRQVSAAGACQGAVPPHVRHPRADGQPVDASAAAAPALIGLAHCDLIRNPPPHRGPRVKSACRSMTLSNQTRMPP